MRNKKVRTQTHPYFHFPVQHNAVTESSTLAPAGWVGLQEGFIKGGEDFDRTDTILKKKPTWSSESGACNTDCGHYVKITSPPGIGLIKRYFTGPCRDIASCLVRGRVQLQNSSPGAGGNLVSWPRQLKDGASASVRRLQSCCVTFLYLLPSAINSDLRADMYKSNYLC